MVLSEKNATFVVWLFGYLVIWLFSCLVGSNDYPQADDKSTKRSQMTNRLTAAR